MTYFVVVTCALLYSFVLLVSFCLFLIFLASPDALEVIVVSYSLPDLLSVSTDLTDVTLVSDDTY